MGQVQSSDHKQGTKGGQRHDCFDYYGLVKTNRMFSCTLCVMVGYEESYECVICGDLAHKGCIDPCPTIKNKFLGDLEFKETVTGVQRCCACQEDIQGISYHCKAKQLYLHHVCSKLDRKIVHGDRVFNLHDKLRSKCNSAQCSKPMTGWSYVSGCKNDHFHTTCFMNILYDLKMKLDSGNGTQLAIADKKTGSPDHAITLWSRASSSHQVVENHSHKHRYHLTTSGEVVFKCNGCKMLGVGKRYACNLCSKTLHKDCMYPPDCNISHDYFGSSRFVFMEEVIQIKGKNMVCSACCKQVRGFSYYCHDRTLSLHPECYKLPQKFFFDQKIFRLNSRLPGVSGCVWCDTDPYHRGWAYVSECKNYNLHAQCLMDWMYETQMKNGYMTSPHQEESAVDLATVVEELKEIESGKQMTDDEVLKQFLTTKGRSKFKWRNIKMFLRTLYNHYCSSSTDFTVKLVKEIATRFKLVVTSYWTKKIFVFVTTAIKVLIATSYIAV